MYTVDFNYNKKESDPNAKSNNNLLARVLDSMGGGQKFFDLNFITAYKLITIEQIHFFNKVDI